jgi:MFS family permease
MSNIIILGLTSLLTDISTEMVYPLLPFFLTSTLGAGPAVLGLIEGIAESLASLLKVVSGRFSDTLRARKPFAILGYASSTAGKILLALSTSWGMVLGGRVVDRLGKGVRTAPRDALIADSIEPRRRGFAFGLHRSMDTLGAAIGVLLAYAFLFYLDSDYRSIFLWSLLPAALGVLLLFAVRETVHKETGISAIPRFQWKPLQGKLRGFLAIVFLFSLGNSSNVFLLLRAHDLGFTAANVILLYLTYNLSFALLSLPAGRLSDRIGRKTLLVAGYLVYGGVYLTIAVTERSSPGWILWCVFTAYGLYSALTEGIERALITDLAPEGQRASALGLHATLVGVGLLPASLIAGSLWDLAGPAAPFFMGAGMSILAAFGMLFTLDRGPLNQHAAKGTHP